MEVVVPPAMDFNFNSPAQPSPSPYLSAPSSPKLFGDYYFSAPTSPRRLSEFYSDFDDSSVMISPSSVPFDWEERPGTPKSPKGKSKPGFEDDFAFDVGGEELEKTTLPAEELFDGGKIRPLKLPPQLHVKKTGLKETGTRNSSALSPRSPISNFRGAFSPRRKKETDPFAAAAENTRKRTEQERGRERVASLSSSSSGRRGARSLSPYRVSKYPWEEEQNLQQQQQNTKQSSTTARPGPALSPAASSLSSSSASKGYRKWKLKDFFLFRSSSEGRAADNDPLKKYSALFRKHEDIKNSSFRSIEVSNTGSSSKRRGAVSPHEMHYAVNRAVSEDLKKKTFLPYKQGILGRLAFNPAVHALANGFGFSRK